jgi:hypothetical protein
MSTDLFPGITNPEARAWLFWRWLDFQAAKKEQAAAAAAPAAPAAPAAIAASLKPKPKPQSGSIASRVKSRRSGKPPPPPDSVAARVKARRG